MNNSKEAGAAFLSGLVTDCEVLSERLQTLHGSLEEERNTRTESIGTAFKRMSGMDQSFADRSEQQAATIAASSASIDAVSSQCHSLGTQMQAQIDALCGRQAALESKCVQGDEFRRQLTKLEETIASRDKHTLSDVGRLSSSLESLREEIKRGQASREAAEDRFQKETLLLHKDISKMATAVDLSRISTKCATLEAHIDRPGGLLAGFSMLQERLAGTEASIQATAVDLMKSVSNELQPFRQTVCNLSTEVTRNQALLKDLEAIVSPLPDDVLALSASVKSLDRRHDTESERTNACWVSLEKELASKVTRIEFDLLGSRMDKVEQTGASLVHLASSKASIQDVQSIMAHIDALDASCSAKADGKAFEKIRLTVANQTARCDELQSGVEGKIESLSSQMHTFVTKSLDRVSKQVGTLEDGMEKQLKQLQEELRSCPCRCTKEDLDQQLLQFYPRHEMDSLLARIWWRLGQTGKPVGFSGVTSSPGAIVVRTEGQQSNWHTVSKPERPQSARHISRPQSAHCNGCGM